MLNDEWKSRRSGYSFIIHHSSIRNRTMPTANRDTPVATTYARALLDLAGAEKADEVRRELADVTQMLDAEPAFAEIVADPGVSEQRRGELVERVFGDGRVSPLMRNFLRVLNAKGRLNMLPEIRAVYERLRDEQLGNVDVEVTVARPLSDDQLETVRRRVGTALGRNAVVRQNVDDS